MGCGESKHAVATTDSISTSSRLKSKSGKKSHSGRLSKDIKDSISDDATNIVPENTNKPEKASNIIYSNVPNTSFNAKKRESPVKISANEDEKNQRKENEISNNAGSNFKMLDDTNEEKSTEENIVKPLLIPEIKNEEKDNSVESIVKEDDKSNDLSYVSRNKHENQANEIKVLEPLNQDKKIKEDFRESSRKSSDKYLSTNTNNEDQTLLFEPVVKSVVQKDEMTTNLLNQDKKFEEDGRESFGKSSDKYLSNTEVESIPHENIVESASIDGKTSTHFLDDDQNKKQTAEIKVEKPATMHKKDVEDNKELSREVPISPLLSTEINLESHSLPHQNILESASIDDKNSTHLLDDQHEKQTTEIKVEKIPVMTEKEDVEDSKELSLEAANSPLLSTEINLESHSLPHENIDIVQPAVKEDVIKSLNTNIEEKKEIDTEEVSNETHEVKEEGFPVTLEITPKDDEMASQPPLGIVTKDH